MISVHIVYIIDSLKIGGAEMLLLAMLQTYTQRNHEITVLYFTPGPLHKEIEEHGVTLHQISQRGLKDPFLLPRLYKLIRQLKPDVVHTHLFKSHMAGQISAFLAQVPARVASFHNTDPWRKKRPFSLIFRTIMRPCHRYIAVSSEVRTYTLKWTKHAEDKMIVIDNGVDTDRFNVQTVTPVDKNATWGIPADSSVVGIIGRLEEQKGHEVFLQAAAKVVENLPEVRFVIIGDGPRRDELEQMRNSLGLQDHVIFAGIMRNIPEAMASLDVVTFSSHWEGLPVVLLEALAMSRPLVSTSVGGIPDVIVDGETGVLVPPNEPNALASGLQRVLNDVAFGARIGTAGRKLIEQHYSSGTMHQQILDLYNNILNDKRGTANAYPEH